MWNFSINVKGFNLINYFLVITSKNCQPPLNFEWYDYANKICCQSEAWWNGGSWILKQYFLSPSLSCPGCSRPWPGCGGCGPWTPPATAAASPAWHGTPRTGPRTSRWDYTAALCYLLRVQTYQLQTSSKYELERVRKQLHASVFTFLSKLSELDELFLSSENSRVSQTVYLSYQ